MKSSRRGSHATVYVHELWMWRTCMCEHVPFSWWGPHATMHVCVRELWISSTYVCEYMCLSHDEVLMQLSMCVCVSYKCNVHMYPWRVHVGVLTQLCMFMSYECEEHVCVCDHVPLAWWSPHATMHVCVRELWMSSTYVCVTMCLSHDEVRMQLCICMYVSYKCNVHMYVWHMYRVHILQIAYK